MAFVNWIIDQIPNFIKFMLAVFLFGNLLYLSFRILGLKKRSSGIDNKFWWDSFKIALILGVALIILSIIFLVIFIAAAMAILGGATNPFEYIFASTIGQAAENIFASGWKVILMMGIFVFLILLAVGKITQEIYDISFWWALICFALTLIIYILLDYLANRFLFVGGIMGSFDHLGNILRDWVWSIAFPNP